MTSTPFTTASSVRFPIPMRGNEEVLAGRHDRQPDMFPIPMRGNELGLHPFALTLLAEFPIPMRGNESERRWPRRGPLSRVSDPHEG